MDRKKKKQSETLGQAQLGIIPPRLSEEQVLEKAEGMAPERCKG